MPKDIYRYTFAPEVPVEEIETSMLLAVLASESLHGESQVRLNVAHSLDLDTRVCVIDAGTAVGRDLNRLFVGFVRRKFGEDAFNVDRISKPPAAAA